MKYANIKYINQGAINGKGNVNIGDAFELLAIDKLYRRMGIPDSDIIEIDLEELCTYNGEEVILPINFLMVTYFMGNDIADMSPKIIPVFLGVSFTHRDFTDKQICFLKKFEPIGCRDERTKNVLNSMGVKAYLNGCIALTHERNLRGEIKQGNKVAFIDVPKDVEPYIPNDIRRDMEILHHAFYVSREEALKDPSFKNLAQERLQYYQDNVRMIVTSRFHGAVIGLALEIPVILVAENEFYKFSFLSKLLPFYTREKYHEIDWNPKVVDISVLRQNIVEVAISRIKYIYAMHCDVPIIEKVLSNDKRDDSDNLCYIYNAIEHIKKTWNKDVELEYGIWGVSQNAQKLFEFISKEYPRARLTVVYDALRKTVFQGIESVYPSEKTISGKEFIFVASDTAKEAASDLFAALGKKNYFLCTLEFIR